MGTECGHKKNTQTRFVVCKNQHNEIVDDLKCNLDIKPKDVKICPATSDCPKYIYDIVNIDNPPTCHTGCGVPKHTITIKKINCIKSFDTSSIHYDHSFCERYAKSIDPNYSGPPKITEDCPATKACPYMWNIESWSTECSTKCGMSEQIRTRISQCIDSSTKLNVEDSKCSQYHVKPIEIDICKATKSCPKYFWNTNSWSPIKCSTECGLNTSYRKREVYCQDEDGLKVDLSKCENLPNKPTSSSICNATTECPTKWIPSEFPYCPNVSEKKNCGMEEPFVTRIVKCFKNNNIVDDNECDYTKKPNTIKKCRSTYSCPKPQSENTYKWMVPPMFVGTPIGCPNKCGQKTGDYKYKRLVYCVDKDNKTVAPYKCTGKHPDVVVDCPPTPSCMGRVPINHLKRNSSNTINVILCMFIYFFILF